MEFSTFQPFWVYMGTSSNLATSSGHRTMWGGEEELGVSRLMLSGRYGWVKKRLVVSCHPGDLRPLFLEEAEKEIARRKKLSPAL